MSPLPVDSKTPLHSAASSASTTESDESDHFINGFATFRKPCQASLLSATAILALVLTVSLVFTLVHPLTFDSFKFMPARSSCGDEASCLAAVDTFLDSQPRATYKNGAALVQTYGASSPGSGGPCGENCQLPVPCPDFEVTGWCRFDTYDNALVAIYYTMRGQHDKAKRILDAFIQLLYPEQEVPTVTFGAADGLPSKRLLTLLAASYTPKGATAGQYWGDGVADGAVDTGNNAWVAIAFARYAAATGQACYALPARDIFQAIKSRASCNDALQGFMARFPPYPGNYRSTEHNIDLFALSRMLGEQSAQASAAHFVTSMKGYTLTTGAAAVYATGTSGAVPCDAAMVSAAVPVDAQLWNILADAADPAGVKSALRFSLQDAGQRNLGGTSGFRVEDEDLMGNGRGQGQGQVHSGLRFSSFGSGAQWENTASGVMAMIHYRATAGEVPGLSDAIVKMRSSLERLLGLYGAVPASILGGNMKAYQLQNRSSQYPGGSDTGLGWTYLRYPHTAATAWTGMMIIMQSTEQDAVDEQGNPYSVPTSPVPDAAGGLNAALQCLPAAPSATPATTPAATSPGKACQSHSGCSSLAGNCCPTDDGVMLGCC